MRSSNLLRTAAATTLALAAALAPAAASAMHASTPSPWAASGSGGGLSWAIEGSVGAIGGKSYERVLDGDFKVSQLDWELKNIALAGVEGSVSVAERLQINLGFWTAVGEGDGMMIDRDWLLRSADTDDEWTHESRHPDTVLEEGTVFDLNVAVKALNLGPLALSGIVGYTSDTWKWSARGGTYVYSDIENGGFRDLRGSFPAGPVIEYEQVYKAPYLGVGLDGDIGALQLHGHLLYSPWVSATDRDYHVLRDTLFLGDFSGGKFVELGVSATFFFTPQLFVGASVEAQQFSEVVGDVTIEAPEGRGTDRDGGSVELGVAAVLLSAGYRF